jgi:hypothetical protein
MPNPIYLVLGAILIVVSLLAWWRSGWAMIPSARKALQEILWLSCLCGGIILMITAATEGVPYTSIHIRGDWSQDIVGAIGFILAAFGTYYGFSLGYTKTRQSLPGQTSGPPKA